MIILDCELGSTVYVPFAVNDTGGSAADGSSPVADVRLCGAASDAAPVYSPTVTGPLSHANYADGLYEVPVACTEGNGFASGNYYTVYAGATVDTETPQAALAIIRVVPTGDSLHSGAARVMDAIPNAAAGAENGLAIVGSDVGAAASVTGDVGGKVLGGGSGTIIGTGVRAVDDSGNAIAPASTALSSATWTATRAGYIDNLSAGAVALASAVAALNNLSSAQAQAAAAAALAAYGASTYAGGDTAGTTTLLDRLTAARAGYLDELGAANLPADVDTLKTYCDVLDDATNGLAAIKTLLVTAAGDVAGLDGSAMLSAATVKSTIEAAGSHLALIKAVTDSLSGAATAGVFSAEALANAPGGTLTAEAIDTQLSGTHGSGAWGGSAGSGAYTVTVTVQTSGGTVYEGVRVSVNNTSETASPLVAYTNSSGQAVFYLDAGAWRAIAAANSAQSGGATNVTVDGAESVTVTVTAVTVPAATSADNYVLYGYGRKAEADAAFGASGLSVEIVRIEQAAQYDATANATRHIMGTSYATDATGLWSLEIAKVLAGTRLDLKFSWTDADSVTRTETWYATIAASAANESDQIAWADLSPVRKS